MRVDSTFFLELQFCNEHGIPHSQFLDWEIDDRAKAIAFILEKSSRCVMCGTAEWEWDENPYSYEPVEKHCHGCYLKEVASRDSARNPGVSIELMPTGTQASAQRRVKERSRAARAHAAKAKR